MTKTLQGVVHGKVIELAEDLGLNEGQLVDVTVRVRQPDPEWGQGILRSAGVLADDPYWDSIMEEIQRSRKQSRRPQMEDE